MLRCGECGGPMVEERLAEYEDSSFGIPIRILDSVVRSYCPNCGEEAITIPNSDRLVAAAAVTRALIPIKFTGGEIRFLRKALRMTQEEFAKQMDVQPETVSRWE